LSGLRVLLSDDLCFPGSGMVSFLSGAYLSQSVKNSGTNCDVLKIFFYYQASLQIIILLT